MSYTCLRRGYGVHASGSFYVPELQPQNEVAVYDRLLTNTCDAMIAAGFNLTGGM